MPLIIDGYNLLHSIQKTNDGSGVTSDVQLCRIIGRYLSAIGESGEIIFDGTGGATDKDILNNISNLEVLFSGAASDADTIIENKIRANTAPKRLTVVSSDQRLRKAARARKAISVKCEEFWSNLCKQLSRKKTVREPAAKRHGLSESETKQWLKLFGLEQ